MSQKNLCKGVYNLRWRLNNNPNGPKIGGVFKIIDNKYMVAALGHGEFSKEKRKLPTGYKKLGLSKHQRDYFCREKRPEPKLNGLEVDKWVESIRDQSLKIKDIMKLKKGDRIKVLVMDRNLGDVITTENKGNKLYKPRYFFRKNWAIYIHDHDMQGKIIWEFDKKNKQPFEFHVEYKKDNWYPFEDGKLPKKDPQGFSSFSYKQPKSWKKFSKETRVGWRGPMLLWDKVGKQKDVYWYES